MAFSKLLQANNDEPISSVKEFNKSFGESFLRKSS